MPPGTDVVVFHTVLFQAPPNEEFLVRTSWSLMSVQKPDQARELYSAVQVQLPVTSRAYVSGASYHVSMKVTYDIEPASEYPTQQLRHQSPASPRAPYSPLPDRLGCRPQTMLQCAARSRSPRP